MLCEAAHQRLFGGSFVYIGRDILKGVMGGKAYPLVAIDVERKQSRREIAELERQITNQTVAEPLTLARFLRSVFMEEGMELPGLIHRASGPTQELLPVAYREYVEIWNAEHGEVSLREMTEEMAAEQAAGSVEGIDPIVTKGLDQLISANNLATGQKTDPSVSR